MWYGRDIETTTGEGTLNKVVVKTNTDGEYITEFSFMYKEGSE